MMRAFELVHDLKIPGPKLLLLEHRLPLQAGFEAGQLALALARVRVTVMVWVSEWERR